METRSKATRDLALSDHVSPSAESPARLRNKTDDLRNKTDELSAILHSNNVDICCVSETWLNENTPTESVDIEHHAYAR